MSYLDTITKQKIETELLPISEILQDSLYYPSCGFDGGVVKDCNTIGRDFRICNFIYCDYARGIQAFSEMQNTFIGYHILGSRSVRRSELIPAGWIPSIPPNFDLAEYQRYKDEWKPFIHWTVYERDESRVEDHGPKRFSLLYLGGEGVATYQALYWTNKTCPKALAIIQPGNGFGHNWTNFKDKNASLAWVVYNNPAGIPQIIYYGGYCGPYDDFDWSEYAELRIINSYYGNRIDGEVRVLKKST